MNGLARINVARKGYQCLSIEDGIIQDHPLGIKSSFVSREYLRLQEKGDMFLDENISPWTLFLRKGGDKFILGMSIRYSHLTDEKGRSGLRFTFSLQGTAIEFSPSMVVNLLKILSISNCQPLSMKIESIATTGNNIEIFLQKFYKAIVGKQDNEKSCSKGNLSEVSRIIHDCNGGSALAWYYSALLVNNSQCDVHVHDIVSGSGGLETHLSFNTTESILTSQIFEKISNNGTINEAQGKIKNVDSRIEEREKENLLDKQEDLKPIHTDSSSKNEDSVKGGMGNDEIDRLPSEQSKEKTKEEICVDNKSNNNRKTNGKVKTKERKDRKKNVMMEMPSLFGEAYRGITVGENEGKWAKLIDAGIYIFYLLLMLAILYLTC